MKRSTLLPSSGGSNLYNVNSVNKSQNRIRGLLLSSQNENIDTTNFGGPQHSQPYPTSQYQSQSQFQPMSQNNLITMNRSQHPPTHQFSQQQHPSQLLSQQLHQRSSLTQYDLVPASPQHLQSPRSQNQSLGSQQQHQQQQQRPGKSTLSQFSPYVSQHHPSQHQNNLSSQTQSKNQPHSTPRNSVRSQSNNPSLEAMASQMFDSILKTTISSQQQHFQQQFSQHSPVQQQPQSQSQQQRQLLSQQQQQHQLLNQQQHQQRLQLPDIRLDSFPHQQHSQTTQTNQTLSSQVVKSDNFQPTSKSETQQNDVKCDPNSLTSPELVKVVPNNLTNSNPPLRSSVPHQTSPALDNQVSIQEMDKIAGLLDADESDEEIFAAISQRSRRTNQTLQSQLNSDNDDDNKLLISPHSRYGFTPKFTPFTLITPYAGDDMNEKSTTMTGTLRNKKLPVTASTPSSIQLTSNDHQTSISTKLRRSATHARRSGRVSRPHDDDYDDELGGDTDKELSDSSEDETMVHPRRSAASIAAARRSARQVAENTLANSSRGDRSVKSGRGRKISTKVEMDDNDDDDDNSKVQDKQLPPQKARPTIQSDQISRGAKRNQRNQRTQLNVIQSQHSQFSQDHGNDGGDDFDDFDNEENIEIYNIAQLLQVSFQHLRSLIDSGQVDLDQLREECKDRPLALTPALANPTRRKKTAAPKMPYSTTDLAQNDPSQTSTLDDGNTQSSSQPVFLTQREILHEQAKNDERLAYKLAFGRSPPQSVSTFVGSGVQPAVGSDLLKSGESSLYGMMLPHAEGDWMVKYFHDIDAQTYFAESGFRLFDEWRSDSSDDDHPRRHSRRGRPLSNKPTGRKKKITTPNDERAVFQALTSEVNSSVSFTANYAKVLENPRLEQTARNRQTLVRQIQEKQLFALRAKHQAQTSSSSESEDDSKDNDESKLKRTSKSRQPKDPNAPKRVRKPKDPNAPKKERKPRGSKTSNPLGSKTTVGSLTVPAAKKRGNLLLGGSTTTVATTAVTAATSTPTGPSLLQMGRADLTINPNNNNSTSLLPSTNKTNLLARPQLIDTNSQLPAPLQPTTPTQSLLSTSAVPQTSESKVTTAKSKPPKEIKPKASKEPKQPKEPKPPKEQKESVELKPRAPRKPKLDESGNPIPPKPRARKNVTQEDQAHAQALILQSQLSLDPIGSHLDLPAQLLSQQPAPVQKRSNPTTLSRSNNKRQYSSKIQAVDDPLEELNALISQTADFNNPNSNLGLLSQPQLQAHNPTDFVEITEEVEAYQDENGNWVDQYGHPVEDCEFEYIEEEKEE